MEYRSERDVGEHDVETSGSESSCTVLSGRAGVARRLSKQYSTSGGLCTMDVLKAAIVAAPTGTGMVGKLIDSYAFPLGKRAFTTLITLCGRCFDWKKAVEVFDSMQAQSISPNAYSYSALITACSTCSAWKEAMKYFEDMKREATTNPGCKPNRVTYNVVVTGLVKGGAFRSALELFKEMLSERHEPCKGTVEDALVACLKLENWETLAIAVDLLHRKSAGATMEAYMCLLRHYAAMGNWQEALETFLTMQMYDRNVDSECCRLLMTALAKAGRVDMVGTLLVEMRKANIVPDIETYVCALRMFADKGLWDDACKVLEQLHDSGILPGSLRIKEAMTEFNSERGTMRAAKIVKVDEFFEQVFEMVAGI